MSIGYGYKLDFENLNLYDYNKGNSYYKIEEYELTDFSIKLYVAICKSDTEVSITVAEIEVFQPSLQPGLYHEAEESSYYRLKIIKETNYNEIIAWIANLPERVILPVLSFLKQFSIKIRSDNQDMSEFGNDNTRYVIGIMEQFRYARLDEAKRAEIDAMNKNISDWYKSDDYKLLLENELRSIPDPRLWEE